MKLTSAIVNHTPVFLLPTTERGSWDDVWGASRRKTDYIFPGYFPFGLLSVRDLEKIGEISFDDKAQAQYTRILESERLSVAAEKSWESRRHADLPLPPGYRFIRQPFIHQSYGVASGFSRYRKHYLWEMGVGKTGTAIELLRLLRALGEFTRAVVLCPPIVMDTWAKEALKVTGGQFKVCLWDSDEVTDKQAKAAGWKPVAKELKGMTDVKKENSRREFVRSILAARASEADIVVASYKMAALEAKAAYKDLRVSPLEQLNYDVIIGDESQCIADVESQQTKAVLALSGRAGRRILLSGTAADHPDKLYPQLRFLAPGLVPGTHRDYVDRYVVKHPYISHMTLGYQNMDELNAKVSMVATRMKKKDGLPDLPPRMTINVPFRLGYKQAKRYNELVEENKASAQLLRSAPPKTHLRVLTPGLEEAIEDGAHVDPVYREDKDFIAAAEGGVRLSKLRQCLSGFLLPSPDLTICDGCEHVLACVNARVKPYTKACKVVQKKPAEEAVRDFENPRLELFKGILSNILESDDTNKVIVWANFRLELDDIEGVCKAMGVGYIRVDGSNSSRVGAFETRFEDDPKCRVWIGQSATGVGITLNAANYTIDYAPTWDRVHDKQKRDRNHRSGQTRNVTEYRLYGEHTLDVFIFATLDFKDAVAFTLLEKIQCAGCDHQERCADEENKPFQDGCVYQPEIDKPKAIVASVND